MTYQNTGASELPPVIARIQASVETMFLRNAALEQELQALRSAPPFIISRPRRPNPFMRLLRRLVPGLRERYEYRIIRESGMFDRKWYLANYPDVEEAGSDPILHYLRFGVTERRDPGPEFSTAHYLHLYPDIARGHINPLYHYVIAGCTERRSIRPGMSHGRGAVAGKR